MLENSYIVVFFSVLGEWLSRQFEKSKIIKAFLSQKENIYDTSIITKTFNYFVVMFQKIFSKIKLDKLLSGSIFTIPFLWILPVIISAPFLTTMLLLALSLFSVLVLLVWVFVDKNHRLKFFTLNKYVLLYIAVYLYAAFASVARTSSIKVALVTIGLILFYFVIINAIDTKRKFHIVMFIFLFGGVIVSLYGIYQYLFPANYGGVWVDTQMFEDIKFRAYSTFANPNVLGEYLLLTIPFAGAYVVIGKTWFKKLVALGVTGVMMLCLLLTYSRGCYVGILLALGIFLVLLDKRFIWLGIVGLLLLPIFMPESIISRFTSIGNMQDSSTSYRVNIWLGTISMLRDYWICGTGPGIDAYNQVYPLYAYSGISAPHSHNLFLQIMCDAGIVGIGAFIAILYKFYRTTFSSLVVEKIKQNRIFIIAGIAAISAFAVQSMFDYTFYNYKVLLIFWMTLAFGTVATKFSSLKEN